MEEAPKIEAAVEEAAPAAAEVAAQISEAAQAALPEVENAMADAGQVLQETGSNLLRYINPKLILPNGDVMSGAFKDATMSVYDEAQGATAQLVLDVHSSLAGIPGQGGVMALNQSDLLNTTGVNGIVQELGTTGNEILDAAHMVVENLGTKGVAQAIKSIAQWIIH